MERKKKKQRANKNVMGMKTMQQWADFNVLKMKKKTVVGRQQGGVKMKQHRQKGKEKEEVRYLSYG